ncbi:MAG: hypothetical protein R3F11_14115 [Verrucomicrobiales bacterium]
MTITDNCWAGQPGECRGDRVGLGEVRFDASPVPEPGASVFGAVALGLVALRKLKRR